MPTENQTKAWEKEVRINELKDMLAKTDYQAIKYAEGAWSAEEYEPIKKQRQKWRDEINVLEAEAKELRNNT